MTKKKTKRSTIARRASIPFALVLGIGLLGLFSISLVKEALRGWEIQAEIASLEQDASQLHQENDDLSNLLAKVQTSAWEEKEARQKLGLSGEGEVVVLLPATEPASAAGAIEETEEIEVPLPNPIKWWYYFTRY